MYFNSEPIPKNESDKKAHRKCSDIEGAKKYCPKRWAALELWMAEARKASFWLKHNIELLLTRKAAYIECCRSVLIFNVLVILKLIISVLLCYFTFVFSSFIGHEFAFS